MRSKSSCASGQQILARPARPQTAAAAGSGNAYPGGHIRAGGRAAGAGPSWRAGSAYPGDAELSFQHRTQADLIPPQDARRHHRVEQVLQLEAEIALQADQVVFGGVEHFLDLRIGEQRSPAAERSSSASGSTR